MSVRARLVVVVTAITAAASLVIGWTFVRQVGRDLDRSLARRLQAQSAALAGRVATTPVAPAVPSGEGDLLTQVVSAQGKVLEASGLAPAGPLVNPRTLAAALQHPVWRTVRLSEDVDARLLAVPVQGPDGAVVAIVGASTEGKADLLQDLVLLLLLTGAVLVGAAAAGTWWLARAALAPVERLRRQVATLSERDPLPRLPVPATGDELAALAGTLNALLARLQRAIDRERSLVADAGHELRTPLAVLQGELELAGRPGRSPEEMRAAVGAAAEEADRLARLADSILFLAGSTAAPRQDVDLATVVTAAAGRARAHSDKGVAVQVQIDGHDRPLVVRGEPESLRRAVENLVDNALGHAPPGSDIVIRAGRQADRAVVEVLDEGPGFPDSFLPFAFERFRRADDSRDRRDGGAGLGLSIVQSVVEAHGGTASVANRAGGGAVARILLPSG